MFNSRKLFFTGVAVVVVLGIIAIFVIRQRRIVLYDPAEFFPSPSQHECIFYVNLPEYKKLVNGIIKAELLELLPEKDRPNKEFIKKSGDYVSRLAIAIYFAGSGERRFFFVTPKISMKISTIKKILKAFYPPIRILEETEKLHDKRIYKVEVNGNRPFWGIYYKGSFILAYKLDDMKWLLDKAFSSVVKLKARLPHRVKGKWYAYFGVREKNLEVSDKNWKMFAKFCPGDIEVGVTRKESGMLVADVYFDSKSNRKLLVDTSRSVRFIVQIPLLKNMLFMWAGDIRGEVVADIMEQRASMFPMPEDKNIYELMKINKKEFVDLFTARASFMIGSGSGDMDKKFPSFVFLLSPYDEGKLSAGEGFFVRLLSSAGVDLHKEKRIGWKSIYIAGDSVPAFVGLIDRYVAVGFGRPSTLVKGAGLPREIKNVYKNAVGSILFLDVRGIKTIADKIVSLLKLESRGERENLTTILSRIHRVVAFLKGKNSLELHIIP